MRACVHLCLFVPFRVCVCVCVCACERMRACVWVWVCMCVCGGEGGSGVRSGTCRLRFASVQWGYASVRSGYASVLCRFVGAGPLGCAHTLKVGWADWLPPLWALGGLRSAQGETRSGTSRLQDTLHRLRAHAPTPTHSTHTHTPLTRTCTRCLWWAVLRAGENVASHLQKYRLYLKKVGENPNEQFTH